MRLLYILLLLLLSSCLLAQARKDTLARKDSIHLREKGKTFAQEQKKGFRNSMKSFWKSPLDSGNSLIVVNKGTTTIESFLGHHEGDFVGLTPVNQLRFSGALDITAAGIPLKVSGMLTTANSSTRQPMNQFLVSLDVSKLRYYDVAEQYF